MSAESLQPPSFNTDVMTRNLIGTPVSVDSEHSVPTLVASQDAVEPIVQSESSGKIIPIPREILDAKRRRDWSWQINAKCKDANPEIFAKSGSREKDAALAKAFCGRCMVRLSCLVFTVQEPKGITANMTEKEREQLRNGGYSFVEAPKIP